MTVIPTYSHLELHALREQLSSRLREFGIRANLPKLELPKLAALAELVENHVQQSDALGRRWLKNVLLTLVLLLESCQQVLETQSQPEFKEPREQRTVHIWLGFTKTRLRFFGYSARILWCCFRN